MKTPKETFISCVENEDHEYLPMFLRDLTLGMDVMNVRTTDVFTKGYDHELSARCVKAFTEFCGQDAAVGCIHSAAFNVEAFGGEMKITEYGIPSVVRHPLEYASDVPEIPLKPSGRAIGALRSYSLVRKLMPDRAVVANVEGPLTKTGTITGMETLSIYTETEKELLHEMISLCTDHTFAFLEELERNGSADCVFLASATDNPDLFGSGVYKEFVIKNLKKMASRIRRMGYPVIFHPHGVFTVPETSEIFSDTIETGIDGFQFAEGNDPEMIIKMIDGRCSVLGGTDVVPTLLNGPEERIRDETLRYIRSCEDANHVFMCSCSLHRSTPLENIGTMADAVHGYNKRIF